MSVWELFSKDPRALSKEERLAIVKELREKRLLWTTEVDSARRSGRRANHKKAGISAEDLLPGIDLDAIGKLLAEPDGEDTP